MQLRLAAVTLFTLFSVWVHAAPQKSVRVRLSSAPSTLDWNLATTGSEGAILQNIMGGLFQFGLNAELKPYLAESYHWSGDGKTLEIQLSTHIPWSDGKTLSAQQFLDSYERILNPNLNSENASLLFDIVGAREYFLGKTKAFKEVGITARDAHTLIFQLKEPRANFLNILTHWSTFPYRKDRPTATLGPYRLSSQSKTKWTLKARSQSLPIQTAQFEVVPEGVKALELFRAKQLDYLLQVEDHILSKLPAADLTELGVTHPAKVVALLHLNPSRVETNTPEKRRAVMAAISQDALVQLQPKTRDLANSIIPLGLIGNTDPKNHSRFQPEGKAGSNPQSSLTLAYPNDSFSRTLAEQIQAHLKGIKIVIEPLPPGDLASVSKRYDLVLTLFGLDYYDPDQLLSSFLSQGTHDLFNLSSSELLKIIQEARSTENIKKRAELYQRAARYLESQTAIVMPLFYRRRAFLLRDSFDFEPGFQGTAQITQIRPKK